MVQPRHQLGGDGGGVLRQIATIHAPQRQGQIQEEGSLAPRRWKSAWTALLEVWTPWLPGILAMRSRATSAAPGRGSQACVRSLGSPPRAAVRGRQKGWAMPRRKAPIAPASRGHEDGPPSANPLFITSLEKGLRVLYAFQNLHRALGLTEIAAVTGLSVSAVQRFVHTWQALGYLRKEPGSRRYTLAPRLLDFSCMYQQTSGLVAVAMPHLIALSEQCQETVNLLEPDGTDLLYVARLPRHEIRYPAGVIGARIPAFCTSGGRAILAHLPEAAVQRLLDDADLTPRTPYTMTDRHALLACITDARHRGYGLVDQEGMLGEISVAAAILAPAGDPIAAVSVPVPTPRWTVAAVQEHLAPKVVVTARAIARAYGAGTHLVTTAFPRTP